MLVMSTTTQMLALTNEIEKLLMTNEFQHRIGDMKIKQLSRLTTAAALLYASAAFYVLSGIIAAIIDNEVLSEVTLALGVILTFGALTLLIIYSYNAIRIGKKQFEHKHDSAS